MRNFSAILALALLAAPPAFAADAGTASGLFLRLPPSAAGAGMGDAGVAVVAGSPAIFVNPAGLAGVKCGYASFTHAAWADSLSYNAVSAAYRTRNSGVAALGVRSLSYGEISSFDNTGAAAGNFSPRDVAAEAAWAGDLDKSRSVGFSMRYISSRIKRTASAFAVDMGYMQRSQLGFFGAALQNSGGGLQYGDEAAPLPLNLKVGVGAPFGRNVIAALDLNFTRGAGAWMAAGGKYTVPVPGDMALSVRAGYSSASSDTGGINGFALGFGLAGETLAFDYSLRTMGELGVTHQLGLSFKWDRPAPKPEIVRETPFMRAPARRPAAR